MAPEVAAVDRKGGYNQSCDIWSGKYFFFDTAI